ncbi:phosphonate ABC transporter, permease protein PhnE [Halorubrum sp. CBA1125]|uniref:phosphonate ABC transporter, permease protein PhnE n=1 Tax=Halorubrum sp. CBA1125 TaxID=2668072 RepID=UPI0012E8E423|nr:phosphonate ABC transporter, permease protein PhnE [Halorubrum sp. CBA1125]MUW14286.1 phosphonate ABC transporter, permease protein PhnE [Halorubrum sp. CBA1125]
MAADQQTWRRPTAFYNRTVKWLFYIGSVLFVGLLLSRTGVSPGRFWQGILFGIDLVGQMVPPTATETQFNRMMEMLGESVAMSMLATVLGVLISIPFGFLAAENLVPKPVYYLNRSIIMVSRSLHSLIVAIIFVKAFGLGVVAGVLTLSFKTIGYWSKLFAEDLEDIDRGQMEAIEATGGSRLHTIVYGVVPQVIPRAIGLTVYRWDINIRQSTIIGIVGAGGIGTVILAAFDKYQYQYASTILLAIVAVVMVGEAISAITRRRVE